MIENVPDLNSQVIFVVILGAMLSVGLPILYQNNRHKFENKRAVINELNRNFLIDKQIMHSINLKIINKYFTFDSVFTDEVSPGINVKRRMEPLAVSLKKSYDKIVVLDKIVNMSIGYSTIFENKKIIDLKKKRNALNDKLGVIYFQMCYDEKSSKEALEIMKPTSTIIDSIKQLESDILLAYSNRFSFWYPITSRFH